MRPEALQSLAAVREFLGTEILPKVDHDLGSELRAAIKVMREAELELEEAISVTRTGCDEILAACAGAHDLLAEHTLAADVRVVLERHGALAPGEAQDVAAANDRHRHVRELARATIALLAQHEGEHATAALRELYGALGRDARRRAAWQSVFVEPRS